MKDLSLAKIEAVRAAIEAACTVQEIKETLDTATAMKVYAEQARKGKEIELKLGEYIVRAERRLGEILQAAKEAGQITHAHDPRHKAVINGEDNRFTLKEAGISLNLSSRAQKISAIPNADFEQRITEGKETGKLTPNTVLHRKSSSKKKPRKAPKRHDRADEVMNLADQGLSQSEISKRTGISKEGVRPIIDDELLRREGKAQAPEIDIAMLSMTAQQKLDTAIRQHKQKLDAKWNIELNERVNEFLTNTIGPRLEKQRKYSEAIIKNRKGMMNRNTFNAIRRCLHPDITHVYISDLKIRKLYDEAWHLFEPMEKFLLNEKDSPTQFAPPLPTDLAEERRKATEARKAKRAAGREVQKN